ncbi:MAG: hypothetical protein ACPF9Q_05375, partial [Opitutales bacterium]
MKNKSQNRSVAIHIIIITLSLLILSACKPARQNQEDRHDPASETQTTAHTMSDENNHDDHDHDDEDQEDPKAHPIDPRDQ